MWESGPTGMGFRTFTVCPHLAETGASISLQTTLQWPRLELCSISSDTLLCVKARDLPRAVLPKVSMIKATRADLPGKLFIIAFDHQGV